MMAEEVFEKIIAESMNEDEISEADQKKKLYERFHVSSKYFYGLCIERNLWYLTIFGCS